VAQTKKSYQSLKNFLKVFERGVGKNFFQKVFPIPIGKLISVAILGGGTKMAAAAIVWNCK
jgi:hypothetical protein